MKWIPVDERLPEIEQTVIVYDESFVKEDSHGNKRGYSNRVPGIRFGRVMKSGWFRSEGVNGKCEITHWQPIPEPPQ